MDCMLRDEVQKKDIFSFVSKMMSKSSENTQEQKSMVKDATMAHLHSLIEVPSAFAPSLLGRWLPSHPVLRSIPMPRPQ